MRPRAAVLAGGLLLGLAACSSGGSPTPTPPSTVAVPTAFVPPAPTPSPIPPAPIPATVHPTVAADGPDPVAFFRAQQAGCRTHARATANPEVEPARFAGAKLVRDLGGGAVLIEDGRGTRLVVEAAKGVVLPPSGKVSDAMPAPYAFGCSEKVFQGANAD